MASSVAGNNIKVLFFEDVMSQLSGMGYGNNWMVFAGGGSINSKTGACSFHCTDLAIDCTIKSNRGLASKFKSFDLREPNCHIKIINWIKENHDNT